MVATDPTTQRAEATQHTGPEVLTGAQITCRAIEAEGVTTVFGYPGGAVIPLYDAIPDSGLHHVLTRFEQWSGMAAIGYARATGKVGCCIATSGPGATNLVTALADAMLDSVPIVAITGQVIEPLIGRDGFQEVDITGITLPVTKHNYIVHNVADIATTIKEAFYLARSGRPGPVLVDIPKNIFVAKTEYIPAKLTPRKSYQPTTIPNMRQVRLAADEIAQAKRPLIMAGHGVILSGAEAEFTELVEKTGIPTIFTLLGLGAMDEMHPLAIGMMGMHGHRRANRALDECDLLINFGARFDDRATGNLSGFAPNARVIHVDIDPAEIGKNVKTAVPVVGDIKEVLKLLTPEVKAGDHSAWRTWIEGQHNRVLRAALEDRPAWPEPYAIIKEIADATGHEAIVTTDVGQHQMWAAQHLGVKHGKRWITSGGLGTMGFGLPSAVGAKMGRPDLEVWTIIGDGGFQMSGTELATAVQENLDINIAIINNGYLGMVRQWQDLFHARNYSEVAISGPDFVKLAEAYGATGIRVRTDAEIRPAIEKARSIKGPVLIDFVVEPEANVYPMVAPGASNSQMIEGRKEEE
ncbi:MAG: biosynthetic-type acetolactate synthase large subunit [Thermomicrobiales bacterium]|nr:biosynthetic-type acetolactate synthase large subunit [Thermomicrobiales bacterium]